MQINHILIVVAPSQHTGQPVLIKKLCFLVVSGFEVSLQESTCHFYTLPLNHLVGGESQP